HFAGTQFNGQSFGFGMTSRFRFPPTLGRREGGDRSRSPTWISPAARGLAVFWKGTASGLWSDTEMARPQGVRTGVCAVKRAVAPSSRMVYGATRVRQSVK